MNRVLDILLRRVGRCQYCRTTTRLNRRLCPGCAALHRRLTDEAKPQ